MFVGRGSRFILWWLCGLLRSIPTSFWLLCFIMHLCFVWLSSSGIMRALTGYFIEKPCYSADCFRPAFSENHFGSCLNIFRIFNETEMTQCPVARPKMFLVHWQDCCCLPQTAAVNWNRCATASEQKEVVISHDRYCLTRPVALSDDHSSLSESFPTSQSVPNPTL